MDLYYLVQEPKEIKKDTPLLVLLHGYGSNEEDLFSFVPTLPQEWLIVSFRAPRTTQFEGYAWYDIDFMDKEKFINTTQANESLNSILMNIQKVKNHYGNTEGKIHLCGFSQGGILCYALALTKPDYFQKVACLSAYPEPKILQSMEKDKKQFSHLRFFVSHGMEDAVIPIEWGRRASELLYDNSIYFSFREYMSGHGVNQKNYMDLMDFFNS